MTQSALLIIVGYSVFTWALWLALYNSQFNLFFLASFDQNLILLLTIPLSCWPKLTFRPPTWKLRQSSLVSPSSHLLAFLSVSRLFHPVRLSYFGQLSSIFSVRVSTPHKNQQYRRSRFWCFSTPRLSCRSASRDALHKSLQCPSKVRSSFWSLPPQVVAKFSASSEWYSFLLLKTLLWSHCSLTGLSCFKTVGHLSLRQAQSRDFSAAQTGAYHHSWLACSRMHQSSPPYKSSTFAA